MVQKKKTNRKKATRKKKHSTRKAKKGFASSAQDRQAKEKEQPMMDREIDFTDIPELTDEELKGMRRVGRPLIGLSKRQLISIRIDPDVLAELKSKAKKENKRYQTLINEILAKSVGNKSA